MSERRSSLVVRAATLADPPELAAVHDDDAEPSTAHIGALYVTPSHWRRGAGRALVDAAVALLLTDGGWSALTLWVLEANERARRFYETVGFADDRGRFAHPDGPREIRLRRRL